MICYNDKSVYLGELPSDDLLHDWRNNPQIYKWCRQYTTISFEDQEAWRKRQNEDPKIKMFGIYDYSGFALGVCGLTDIDLINGNAEFSLYIDPNCQGQGRGKEALYVLFRHGFEAFNLKVIWGETFAGNPAINMFEKFGLIKEGTLRSRYYREGKYLDTHIISMTKAEFCKEYKLCME